MEIENKNLDMDKLNSYVRIYDNLSPEKTLKNFTKLWKNDLNFESATIVKDDGTFEVNKKVRNVETYYCSNLNDQSFSVVHWTNYISFMVNEKIKEYAKVLEIDFGVAISDIQILKYVPGGFYKFHIDHGSTTPRTLSMIYCLNDDYEGGDFIVSNCHYRPKKGDAIIFPSNFMFPHRVIEVTKGTRWSIVSWIM